LASTDAGNVGVFQGYSVHRELVLLVESGLSPFEALAASTTNAGRFFGRDWGMKVGSEASLVVLDQSPIANIRNTELIRLVIHRGEIEPEATMQ
jgi:imidazolonepropionase-like amidohydrolase